MTQDEGITARTRAEDVAWAAGLFEGEGCFNAFRKRSGTWQAQASLAMTDKDSVERFALIVGVGSVHGPKISKHENWKPQWQWYVQSTSDVRFVIALLLPWLCERRRAKALEVDAIAETILPQGAARTHCRRGHPYEGDNVIVERTTRHGQPYTVRRCRECRRTQSRERMRIVNDADSSRYRVT